MKLILEPIKPMHGYKRPHAWVIRDEHGNDRGIVRRRARKTLPYWMRGKGLHTLFRGYFGTKEVGTPEKGFQSIGEVRAFIDNNPERYWTSD